MPEYFVPTEEELLSLPRWALVALAVRSARRVVAVLEKIWPDAPNELSVVLEKAISMATLASESGVAQPDAEDIRSQAMNISRSGGHSLADKLAQIAGGVGYSASGSGGAEIAAAQSIQLCAVEFHFSNDKQLAHDIQLIRTATAAEKWNDSTPVPQEFFEPKKVEERSRKSSSLFDVRLLITLSSMISLGLLSRFLTHMEVDRQIISIVYCVLSVFAFAMFMNMVRLAFPYKPDSDKCGTWIDSWISRIRSYIADEEESANRKVETSTFFTVTYDLPKPNKQSKP